MGGPNTDHQPKRLNGLEGEAQLHAWLSFLERRDPEPAGSDAFGQLGLRQAGGFPALAYECADNSGVDGIGHASVWLFVHLGQMLTIINILTMPSFVNMRTDEPAEALLHVGRLHGEDGH
jgi:hypothetical protein